MQRKQLWKDDVSESSTIPFSCGFLLWSSIFYPYRLITNWTNEEIGVTPFWRHIISVFVNAVSVQLTSIKNRDIWSSFFPSYIDVSFWKYSIRSHCSVELPELQQITMQINSGYMVRTIILTGMLEERRMIWRITQVKDIHDRIQWEE